MDEFKPEVPKPEKPYTQYGTEELYSRAPSDQETADPLSIDKGHENRGSLETAEDKPEKKKFSTKKKIASFLAGAALATGVVGIGDRLINNVNRHGNPTKIGATATPGETQTATPNEAKGFVAAYGDRYTDPISTYYADLAYAEKYNTELVMTDSFIKNYDTSAELPVTSSLGFERYNLPKNAKIDQATSMKIFDGYIAKELSLYMNLLAKNQNTISQDSGSNLDGAGIIDFEFTHYCSEAGAGAQTPQDDQAIATLMETAKSVVDKYGSTADYTVLPVSNTDDNYITHSYFVGGEMGHPDIQAEDTNKKVTEFSFNIDTVIEADIFKGQNATHIQDTLKNTEFAVIKQPSLSSFNFNTISIGQIYIPPAQ